MFARKAGQWEMLVPFIGLSLLLLAAGLSTSMPVASAQEPGPGADKMDGDIGLEAAPVSPAAPSASCAGSGPTVDGVALNECAGVDFTVGGDNKSIGVWYTKVVSTATRIVDGTPVTLRHWINTDAQAQQVAAWGQEAWEKPDGVTGSTSVKPCAMNQSRRRAWMRLRASSTGRRSACRSRSHQGDSSGCSVVTFVSAALIWRIRARCARCAGKRRRRSPPAPERKGPHP